MTDLPNCVAKTLDTLQRRHMKPSQQREAAKRTGTIRDAAPETIAKYLKPSPSQTTPRGTPIDSLDKFSGHMRHNGGAAGSRPGSASVFSAGAGAKKVARISCAGVFPGDNPESVPPPGAPQPAPVTFGQPAVFGKGKGRANVNASSVFPPSDPMAAQPPPPQMAGRPRMGQQPAIGADPTAEFAALGLYDRGVNAKNPPATSSFSKLGGVPVLGGQPAQQPAANNPWKGGFGQAAPVGTYQPSFVNNNAMQAFQALPAAGVRRR